LFCPTLRPTLTTRLWLPWRNSESIVVKAAMAVNNVTNRWAEDDGRRCVTTLAHFFLPFVPVLWRWPGWRATYRQPSIPNILCDADRRGMPKLGEAAACNIRSLAKSSIAW
jgi:hypothetical protein